jgi:prepilin-type N-terminal cleavage/methylation domain-containing protein/prepilin-type processing-associated H-X9-DG protein
MNDPSQSTDFSKALLAQDALVNSTDFARLRAQVIQRAERAERRERLARYVTLAFGAVTLIALALIAATNTGAIAHSGQWPEWVQNAVAAAFFLLPVAALLLGAIYLLRHYRELQNARLDAQNQAIAALERQLAELKRSLPETREGGVNRQPTATVSTPSEQRRPDSAVQAAQEPKARKGFTLLELLVTVAVLSLLAALLATALATAKESARATYCQNNLSQLGRVLAMYVGEFRAYPGTTPYPIVPIGVVKNPPSEDTWLWDDRLGPYLGERRGVMRCPSHTLSRRESAYGGEDYRANYNYGYNALGCGRISISGDGTLLVPSSNLGLGCIVLVGGTSTLSVPDAKVAHPADMLAIADREGGNQWTSPVIAPGNPGVRWDDDPGDQHRGRANAVFCDGHCEAAAQAHWKQKSDPARCRWNNDHQPHREAW